MVTLSILQEVEKLSIALTAKKNCITLNAFIIIKK